MITVATEKKLFEEQKITIDSKGVTYYLLDVENNNVVDECTGLLEGYEDIYVFDIFKEARTLQVYTTIPLTIVVEPQEVKDVLIIELPTFTYGVITNKALPFNEYIKTVEDICFNAKQSTVCIVNNHTLYGTTSTECAVSTLLRGPRITIALYEQSFAVKFLKELYNGKQPSNNNVARVHDKNLILFREVSIDIVENVSMLINPEYIDVVKRVIDSYQIKYLEDSTLEEYTQFAEHSKVSAIRKAEEIIIQEQKNLEKMFEAIATSQGIYQSVSKQLMLLKSIEPNLEEFKNVYKSIHMFPEVKSLRVRYPILDIETNVLTAIDPRYNSKHVVGRYTVSIDVNTGKITFVNHWGRLFDALGFHIFGNGDPCLGNISSELPALIKKGDLENSIAYILSFMTTANVNDTFGNRIAGYPLYPYQKVEDINVAGLKDKMRQIGTSSRNRVGIYNMITTKFLQSLFENKENITPLDVVWGEEL